MPVLDLLDLLELPDDVRLVRLNHAAAAADCDPRKFRQLVHESGVAVVTMGERGAAIRLRDLRQIIARHEVTT